jgi:hypothetical protein
MEVTDPSGRRMREAFKRIQLVARKPTVARLPFIRFMLAMQELLHRPMIGRVFQPVIMRVMGGDERSLTILFTPEELARSQRMSFEELAEDALAAKQSP